MKRLLPVLLVVLFALFAGLWTYVQSDSFAQKVRPYVARPMQDVLGQDSRIGRVKVNLLPLYLEVRDLVIPAPDRGQAVAVRKIKLYVNPFPLILGKLSIPSVTVLDPQLTAERSSTGEIDALELAKRIRENIRRRQAAGPSRFAVHIKSLNIRNGTVTFRDAVTESRLTVSRLAVQVRTKLSGESVALRVASADISVAAAAHPGISGKLRASFAYDQGKVTVQAFDIASRDARLGLSGTIGSLTPEGGLALQLTSRLGPRTLAGLSDALKDRRQRGLTVETAVMIRGTLSDPRMDGTVAVRGLAAGNAALPEAVLKVSYAGKSLSASGSNWKITKDARQVTVDDIALELAYRDSVFELSRFALRAGDLTLQASGRIAPSTGYDVLISAESAGKGGWLALFINAEAAGTIQGKLSGPLAQPVFEGRLAAGPVVVRGVVFDRANGAIRYQQKTFSLTGTDIQQDRSKYRFDGSIDLGGPDPVYRARLGVIRSDVVSIVSMFTKRLPLELSASGELTFEGTGKLFSGEGHLDLAAGKAYGESFDRGTVSASLTETRISFPSVVVMKNRGTVKGAGWIGFDKTYSAHIESRGLDLSEVTHLSALPLEGLFTADIRSSGTFSAPELTAAAAMDDLRYQQASAGPAAAKAEISNGVLRATASVDADRLAMEGSMQLRQPYPWALDARVRVEGVDPTAIFGTNNFFARISTSLQGAVRATGNGVDVSSMNGDALFQKLSLTLGDYRIENEGSSEFVIESGRLVVRSLTLTGAGTRVAVSGATQLLRDFDLAFAGDANLSLLRLFYREVEHGDGIAEVKLTVRESWQNPDIAGELRVRNGLIKIKDIPQRFTALNGTVNFDRSRIVTDGVTGEVGGGTVTVSGTAQVKGLALIDFSARASIENITVRYPEGLVATLAGELYYDGDAEEQTLAGDIVIERARYDRRVEWKSMLVDFTKGITQRRKTDVGWIGETRLNVRFHGSENIMLQNNLAKIPLDIDLFFRGTVNQPQTLGRIEARKGEVYFRRNVFKILYASADFVDPNRVNPILDVQAETRVREYRIRLAVSGTADRAVVLFVSDPPLSDSNILALLTLGRKGEELKGKEGDIGVGEGLFFATGKFQDIIESRARSLTGLDRFQVDPYISETDVSVPRVTVGKELVRDRLFMTYSQNVGAPTPEQLFQIEYILDKHVSLVGERNEIGNLGADVKFRFEFR